MNSLKTGTSIAEICRREGLTPRRIRQFVDASLKDREEDVVDNRIPNVAPQESALRLAARLVDEGRPDAVAPLLRVICEMDRYTERPTKKPNDQDARRIPMRKLNINLDRIARKEEKARKRPPDDASP